MKTYFDQTYIRNETVDGETGWTWINNETGIWNGPSREWEELFKKEYIELTKGKDCVVQAGGGLGMYPKLLSKIFKLVYTFEPDPLNFYCLVNNCQSDNIIKINGALGDRHKMVSVNRASMDNVGMHKVVDGGIIPQFMIDDLCLTHCDMILLDIEGYEANALAGATYTIDTFRPLIVCENGTKEIEDYLRFFYYKKLKQINADTFYIYDGKH